MPPLLEYKVGCFVGLMKRSLFSAYLPHFLLFLFIIVLCHSGFFAFRSPAIIVVVLLVRVSSKSSVIRGASVGRYSDIILVSLGLDVSIYNFIEFQSNYVFYFYFVVFDFSLDQDRCSSTSNFKTSNLCVYTPATHAEVLNPF